MESRQQEKNLNCEGKSCQYLFIPFETKTFVEFRENKSELLRIMGKSEFCVCLRILRI